MDFGKMTATLRRDGLFVTMVARRNGACRRPRWGVLDLVVHVQHSLQPIFINAAKDISTSIRDAEHLVFASQAVDRIGIAL